MSLLAAASIPLDRTSLGASRIFMPSEDRSSKMQLAPKLGWEGLLTELGQETSHDHITSVLGRMW